jgi:3-hydroxyacyl-[acyl-carrier-protein] dehydratase
MTASAFGVHLLPHQPPMRLVEDIVDLVAGESARGLRRTRPDDWYFQGHFPGNPVVPAVVLIELLAQTGGLVAASVGGCSESGRGFRVAAIGPFKFPAAARPDQLLDARARVVQRVGAIVRIEGEVLADDTRVAAGSVTLVDLSASLSGNR